MLDTLLCLPKIWAFVVYFRWISVSGALSAANTASYQFYRSLHRLPLALLVFGPIFGPTNLVGPNSTGIWSAV